ncbi:hypothetical protein OG806_40105 [Streptomyces sp. NBC_00882]|uniref:hypothetical protein n=1 Tax=Streptomyces TaxID=1883 RepID=UPI00386370A2|nr:hypothetical protein OG806_40105 [Streptomyces sp. NBC_00882]WSZ64310.1 hypothetical protein OH824_39025 [Streptomyces canus]
MAAREKITVPAHHRVRPHPAQHLRRQPAQQRCQERATARGEPHSPAVELALQYPDLMAKSEDLGVLAMVAHWQ